MGEGSKSSEIILEILTGPNRGKKVRVQGDVIRIGSHPDSDVVFGGLDSDRVALVHAKISNASGRFILYDNEDEFATYHNDKRVDQADLESGDILQFGNDGPMVRFRVVGDTASLEETKVWRKPEGIPFLPRFDSISEGIAFGEAEEFDLDRTTPTTIGRDPSNQIVLNHPQVSLFHSELHFDGADFVFEDQKSLNGSFLGRDRIHTRVLQSEDAIRIGPYLLAYSDGRIFIYDERRKAQVEAQHLVHDVRGGRIRLLDDITFQIKPGELVGVLGPSGAGKSTLLGCLSGMKNADGGKVRINRLDVATNYEYLKQNIGYVPQDDIIHLQLTPQKTFEYVSRLRLPKDTSFEERRSRIEKTLSLLELAGRRDLPIHKLSGGQRKRVSLGVELLTEPNLIFLDEPTSGLDPALESKMMVLFKELAQEGKTLIVTTHLMDNVDLFDKLVILVRGKLVFFGTPSEAKKYFEIDDLRGLFTELTYRSPEVWSETYRKSDEYHLHVAPVLNEQDTEKRKRASAIHRKIVRSRSRSGGLFGGIRQWMVLTRRYAEISIRDRKNMSILLIQAPIIAFFIVLAMKNTPSTLFMLSLSALWFGTSNSAKEIVKELSIYRRERMVNLGLFPYVISKVCVLFSISVLQCTFLFLIVHLLNPLEGNVFYLYGGVLISALVGLLLGLFISSLVDSTDKASSIVPLVLIPQVLFAGAFTPLLGVAAWVSLSMPSRWTYDLMKRIVMETHQEAIPPLVDFRQKDIAEEELNKISDESTVALMEIDQHVNSFSRSQQRVQSVWDRMDLEVKELEGQQKRLRKIQEDLRQEFGSLVDDQKLARKALERQKEIARLLYDEVIELRDSLGPKPDSGPLLDKMRPEWLTDKRSQLKEVVEAYQILHDMIIQFTSTRERLESHLAEIEKRAKAATKSGRILSDGKEEIESEVAFLKDVVQQVLLLEEQFKRNSDQIRAVQGDLTENIKAGRFVFLYEGDSLRKDLLVLGGFCLFFFLAVLWFQGRRDRRE